MALIPQPIFLVGAHRSGTTMLRLMLDGHPQLSFKFESEYITHEITDQGTLPELSHYYEFLQYDRIFQSNQLTINPQFNYQELVNDFLSQTQAKSGKALVGTTVHVKFYQLAKLWPQAKFIYLYRDPRDVASSCIEMGWAGNVWFGVEGWLKAESYWQKVTESVAPEQCFTLSYEALVTDPVQKLTEICEFIGLDYDPLMLSYPDRTTYSLPDVKFLQRWRKKLSERNIQLVEARTADALVNRGYTLSGLPIITVPPTELTQLQKENQQEKLKFRIKRYGGFLVLMDWFARRLRIKPLQNWVKPRWNAISKQYLK